MRRLARAYGTLTRGLLDGAKTADDLGQDFGAGLTEAELRYLRAQEWATTAADIVWRRSKLGLRLTQDQIDSIDAALQ
jgi:glycerol-3-phosphate dehydrogenase